MITQQDVLEVGRVADKLGAVSGPAFRQKFSEYGGRMFDIEKLKKLEAQATPGLWVSEGTDCAIRVDGKWIGVVPYFGSRSAAECDQIYRDFALIVAMRNALPELLAELERLEDRAETAEAKLEYILRLLGEGSDTCPYVEGYKVGPECDDCTGVEDVVICWDKLLRYNFKGENDARD